MREEIKAKADKLGQMYFPDECNVWARDNIEAKFVSSACMEMAEWMQKTMIDKACEWIESYLFDIGFPDDWCRDSANLKSGKQRFLEAMEE